MVYTEIQGFLPKKILSIYLFEFLCLLKSILNLMLTFYHSFYQLISCASILYIYVLLSFYLSLYKSYFIYIHLSISLTLYPSMYYFIFICIRLSVCHSLFCVKFKEVAIQTLEFYTFLLLYMYVRICVCVCVCLIYKLSIVIS